MQIRRMSAYHHRSGASMVRFRSRTFRGQSDCPVSLYPTTTLPSSSRSNLVCLLRPSKLVPLPTGQPKTLSKQRNPSSSPTWLGQPRHRRVVGMTREEHWYPRFHARASAENSPALKVHTKRALAARTPVGTLTGVTCSPGKGRSESTSNSGCGGRRNTHASWFAKQNTLSRQRLRDVRASNIPVRHTTMLSHLPEA